MTINNYKGILAIILAIKYNKTHKVNIKFFIYVIGKKLRLVK